MGTAPPAPACSTVSYSLPDGHSQRHTRDPAGPSGNIGASQSGQYRPSPNRGSRTRRSTHFMTRPSAHPPPTAGCRPSIGDDHTTRSEAAGTAHRPRPPPRTRSDTSGRPSSDTASWSLRNRSQSQRFPSVPSPVPPLRGGTVRELTRGTDAWEPTCLLTPQGLDVGSRHVGSQTPEPTCFAEYPQSRFARPALSELMFCSCSIKPIDSKYLSLSAIVCFRFPSARRTSSTE